MRNPFQQKTASYGDYLSHALVLLRERRVMPLLELEAELLKQARGRLDRRLLGQEKGKPRNRTRSLNLVDWVKANLTRRGRSRTLVVKGVSYIVYLPPHCGHVDGEWLCKGVDAMETVEALCDFAHEVGNASTPE